MANPFVAEIRPFAFNFAPTGWMFCQGQLLSISQNTALFSLLGTTYGGDGHTTFALPDFQGMVPMFYGQGPGLSLVDEGETSGSETVTLLQSEIPSHAHTLNVSTAAATTQDPAGHFLAVPDARSGSPIYDPTASGLSQMAFTEVGVAGSGQPHNNMQPYLCLNFCIATQGVFPPRS